MSTLYRMLLKQGIGAPAVPVVKVGDQVKKGMLIAHLEGLGSLLHASVAGEVAAINVDSIDIRGGVTDDSAYEPIEKCDSIAGSVKAAGLVGMGGAGFPTHVKLATHLKGGTLIANAVECEPLLKHNISQIINEPDKIRRGMLLAMRSTDAARGILAIKKKNTDAIAAFRQALKPEDRIEIAELPDLYPMGEERAIVRETLDTLLEPEQLPSAAGAVVLNVETLARIVEAVENRRPVISKNLTVVGKLKSGRDSHVLMDVPIGTRIGDLIERAGGIDGEYGEIIVGGPFTGKAAGLDDVVTKTTGGVIVAMELYREKRPLGLLVCACGASEERMRDIAGKMGATVIGMRKCKQAKESRGLLKCENPGNCPGQAEKIMELRREKAEALLVGNCSDCTNTVMCVAPKLKMAVHHTTDHVMRAVGHPLVRKLPLEAQ